MSVRQRENQSRENSRTETRADVRREQRWDQSALRGVSIVFFINTVKFPATFQRLMALVFSGLIGTDCLIYLDDIIIFGPTFDVHIIRLEKDFARLQQENLKIKLSKCKFKLAAVKFLGHIVTAKGIGVDPAKISTIQDWPLSQCVTQMRSFLGLAYYRRLIEGFGKIAAPLTKMLENNRPFVWEDDAKNAFGELCTHLANKPILIYPDFNLPVVLDSDA